MSLLPRTHRRFPVALAALGLAVALSGCGSETGEDDNGAGGETTESATPSPTPDPKDDGSETPADPPSGPPLEGMDALLLDASEVPGLNEQTTWSEASTEEFGDQGAEAVGVCQLTSLIDIGAVEVTQREFTTDGGATATQVVATLADTKSVEQTHDVLVTWHERCAAQITAPAKEVGELTDVEVEHGTGQAYVVNYGEQDADEHTWESVAINTHDTWISLVVIESRGQDYNYESGQTPAEQAARAVAAKIS